MEKSSFDHNGDRFIKPASYLFCINVCFRATVDCMEHADMGFCIYLSCCSLHGACRYGILYIFELQ